MQAASEQFRPKSKPVITTRLVMEESFHIPRKGNRRQFESDAALRLTAMPHARPFIIVKELYWETLHPR